MASKKNNPLLKIVLVLLVILLLFVGGYLAIKAAYKRVQLKNYEASLQPFYTPPNPLPDARPGSVLRKGEIVLNVDGLDKAYRILYITQKPNGEKVTSSGMLFIPKNLSPQAPILAWAHGTSGMGDSCAPSRSRTPLNDMDWLSTALGEGFVVVATDYAGLGTPGTQLYLIKTSEAYDVLNSVRAARNIIGDEASTQFVLWGHSQGGHAVFSAVELAKDYAPELRLVAAAASAPAAELSSLLNQQYNKPVAWAIGPEISISWPLVYKDLNLKEILTESGENNYGKLAYDCLLTDNDGIKLHVFLKEDFYKVNPIKVASWRKAMEDQTFESLTPIVPYFVSQGLEDDVVLPGTTADLVKNSCLQGANITTMWMNKVGHIPAANISGDFAVSWLAQRVKGIPILGSCADTRNIK